MFLQFFLLGEFVFEFEYIDFRFDFFFVFEFVGHEGDARYYFFLQCKGFHFEKVEEGFVEEVDDGEEGEGPTVRVLVGVMVREKERAETRQQQVVGEGEHETCF